MTEQQSPADSFDNQQAAAIADEAIERFEAFFKPTHKYTTEIITWSDGECQVRVTSVVYHTNSDGLVKEVCQYQCGEWDFFIEHFPHRNCTNRYQYEAKKQ